MINAAKIATVVLAAGHSTRMGSPKLALRWGKTTVIGKVVNTFWMAGIQEIVVVTGGAREMVEEALQGFPIRTVFNPRHSNESMMLSLQTGLAALNQEIEAAFVALGDQPQIEVEVVEKLVEVYQEKRPPLVLPSYHMRRGHPWLLDRSLWPEVLAASASSTLRFFLRDHASLIHHLPIESQSILQDLDTPEDYRQFTQY